MSLSKQKLRIFLQSNILIFFIRKEEEEETANKRQKQIQINQI